MVHFIRYTVVDTAGNTVSLVDTISVYDNEGPVVTRCPSDLTLMTAPGQHGTTYVPGVADVADNSDAAADAVRGELVQAVRYNAQEGGTDIVTIAPGASVMTMDLSYDGTSRAHVFKHAVTDHNQQPGQCYQTVQVVDIEPPSIQCPADISTPTDTDMPYATITLDDPSPQKNFLLGPGAPPPEETLRITGVATDNSMSAGDTASAAPFGFSGPYLTMRIDLETAYVRPLNSGIHMVGSIDAVTGSPWRGPRYLSTAAGEYEFPLGRSPLGRYTGGTGVHLVRYTATDPSGNAADCVQTVTVYDRKYHVCLLLLLDRNSGYSVALFELFLGAVVDSRNAGRRPGRRFICGRLQARHRT